MPLIDNSLAIVLAIAIFLTLMMTGCSVQNTSKICSKLDDSGVFCLEENVTYIRIRR